MSLASEDLGLCVKAKASDTFYCSVLVTKLFKTGGLNTIEKCANRKPEEMCSKFFEEMKM